MLEAFLGAVSLSAVCPAVCWEEAIPILSLVVFAPDIATVYLQPPDALLSKATATCLTQPLCCQHWQLAPSGEQAWQLKGPGQWRMPSCGSLESRRWQLPPWRYKPRFSLPRSCTGGRCSAHHISYTGDRCAAPLGSWPACPCCATT